MHEEPDNMHDDITNAIKAMETGGSNDAPPEGESANADSTSTQGVAAAIARGPDGKFVSSAADKPPAVNPAAAVTPPSGQETTQNVDQQVSTDPTTVQVDPKAPITLDPSKPPQGWRPETKAKWETIPEDIRQEIIRREENSAQGVDKLRKQYEPMERVYTEAIVPAQQYLAHIKREPTEYIQNMILSEQTLNLGNPAQKMEKLLEIADTYGVPIRQVMDSALGGKLNDFIKQSHEQHKTPAQLPPEVARELQEARAFREKIMNDSAQAEYNAFVSDTEAHPFFEDVKEDMARLIETGACENYKDAYETAIWRNPAIRQREQARLAGIQQNEALKQRQKAAGQISTPTGTPLVVAGDKPAEDESIDDAVRRAWAGQGRA